MADPIVEISDGKLRGTITVNNEGDTVYNFLGIPFAKPPIGDLRFKAPLPVEPWSGIKDVIKEGSPCAQKEGFTQTLTGSEDCLHLNVFTKSITNNEKLKPVIFYIHGGAFQTGSNSTLTASPTFLLKEDIVYVATNYRLGALGFLSLSDPSLEVPGNAGMKDQVLALKWVQKNIEKFGGDPNNVTIAGTSAGSASVCFHILSSLSKGLFHKAILKSGTVLNPWPYLHPQSLDIIKYLKPDCESERELLETLRSIPAIEVVKAQTQLEDDLVNSTFRSFAPCVEKPNPTAFLTRKPIDIITSGEYNKVPMFISYTSNEGLYLEFKPELSKLIHQDPFIPPQMPLPDSEKEKEVLLEEVSKIYNFEESNENKYLAARDSMFTAGIVAFAQHVARNCPQPIYLCKFDVVGSRNALRRMMKMSPKLRGACHGDDMGYIFGNALLDKEHIVPGSLEDVTMKRALKFWTNFAKYGNPTPNEEELNFIWKPATKNVLNYLHFGEELIMKINPEEEEMKLWSKIYSFNDDTKDYMPHYL